MFKDPHSVLQRNSEQPFSSISFWWTLHGCQMRTSLHSGQHATWPAPNMRALRLYSESKNVEGKASLGLHLRRLGIQWNWLEISISQPLSWRNIPPCVRFLNESMIIARQKLCRPLVQNTKKKINVFIMVVIALFIILCCG